MKIDGLKCTLLGHQIKAIKWMYLTEKERSGGILGLTMGAGKTLTLLSFILSQQRNSTKRQHNLIIVPTCVLQQWLTVEIQAKTDLTCYVYHGKQCNSALDITPYDLVLTTYDTVTSQQQFFQRHTWYRIVLDEAHMVKNVYSQRSIAIRSIEAYNRWCLTGTPLSNTLSDLWALAIFLRYPIARNLRTFELALTKRCLIEEMVLQSSDTDIASLGLPELTKENVIIEQTGVEMQHYKQLYQQTRRDVNKSKHMQHIFALISRLRIAATFPCGLSSGSSKIEAIIRLIHKIVVSDKVIVFGMYVKVLSQLQNLLHIAGLPSLLYHGMLSITQRQSLLEEFKASPSISVCLISMAAGYSGINIVEANHVIFCDASYNPTITDQAIARAHRIGQTKATFVYNFMSKDTIDCRVEEIAVSKRAMIKNVMRHNSLNEQLDNRIAETLLIEPQ